MSPSRPHKPIRPEATKPRLALPLVMSMGLKVVGGDWVSCPIHVYRLWPGGGLLPSWVAFQAAMARQLRAAMAKPSTIRRAYVHLHLDTGTALYTTCATEAEIHWAKKNLKQAGHRSRYVSARHLGHQPQPKG